jgi:hypothetical protein
MPSGQCLPKKTRDRKAIVTARKRFETNCGTPTNKWKELGAVVTISGVGFFDIPHTQKPHAGNFAALHHLALIAVAQGAALTACAAIRRPARGEGWGKHRRPWA